jgi:hypothetical protein
MVGGEGDRRAGLEQQHRELVDVRLYAAITTGRQMHQDMWEGW